MIFTALLAVAVLAVDPPEWVVRLDKPPQGSAFAVSPDGRRFAVARDTNWIDVFYRGEFETAVRCNDGDHVSVLAFAPDGKTLAVGCKTSNQLRFFGVDGWQVQQTVPIGHGGIGAIAFHPRLPLTYGWGFEGRVTAIDPDTGTERYAISESARTGSFGLALAVHPGGRLLACASNANDHGRLWNLTELRHDRTLPGIDWSSAHPAFAFHPTGRTLLLAPIQSVVLVETASLGTRWSKAYPVAVKGVAWSGDGRFAAVALNSGVVELLESDTGKVLSSYLHNGSCLSIAAAGNKVVSLGPDAVKFHRWPSAVPEQVEMRGEAKGLEQADPVAALKSIRGLQADPDLAVRLAAPRLEPVARPSAEIRAEVAKAVRGLADDDFDARQRASRRLRELSATAGLEIRRATSNETDPEVLYRLRQLLQDATIPRFDPPVTVSQARWLELLERVNTPAARTVVELLTKGDPDAELTLDAIDALQRMKRSR